MKRLRLRLFTLVLRQTGYVLPWLIPRVPPGHMMLLRYRGQEFSIRHGTPVFHLLDKEIDDEKRP